MEAQAHRSGGTGASLWRHRRIALEAQAPRSGGTGASLWRHRRLALEAQAHRFGGTGALPVLATHAYQARAGASIDA